MLISINVIDYWDLTEVLSKGRRKERRGGKGGDEEGRKFSTNSKYIQSPLMYVHSQH